MVRTSKVWLLLAMSLLPKSASLAAEADEKAEKYTLRHVFRDGQVIHGEVCRETLMWVPLISETRIYSTTTATEIVLRKLENDRQGKNPFSMTLQDIRVRLIGINPHGEPGIQYFDAAKDRDKKPDSDYCRLVGRQFTLDVDSENRASVVSGLDDYLAALKESPHYSEALKESPRYRKEHWNEAIEQMLYELNAYLPSRPVSLGETWETCRTLKIIPMGYPLLHHVGLSNGVEEKVSAKLVSVKEMGEEQMAVIELSGSVTYPPKAMLTGEVRILVPQQRLVSETIVLTDPEASPAQSDPTYKIVIHVEVVWDKQVPTLDKRPAQ
jgi:hypothetical protein